MGVTEVAIAALAVSSASTVYSIAEQRKAGKAQQEGQRHSHCPAEVCRPSQ